MILNLSSVLLFELACKRGILIRKSSILLIVIICFILLSVWIITIENQLLSLTLSWIYFRLWLNPLSSRPYIISIYLIKYYLTLTTSIINNQLMSIMSITACIHNLILRLHLWIIRQLSGVIHIYFSSFIEIHVSTRIQHWVRTLSIFITLSTQLLIIEDKTYFLAHLLVVSVYDSTKLRSV